MSKNKNYRKPNTVYTKIKTDEPQKSARTRYRSDVTQIPQSLDRSSENTNDTMLTGQGFNASGKTGSFSSATTDTLIAPHGRTDFTNPDRTLKSYASDNRQASLSNLETLSHHEYTRDAGSIPAVNDSGITLHSANRAKTREANNGLTEHHAKIRTDATFRSNVNNQEKTGLKSFKPETPQSVTEPENRPAANINRAGKIKKQQTFNREILNETPKETTVNKTDTDKRSDAGMNHLSNPGNNLTFNSGGVRLRRNDNSSEGHTTLKNYTRSDTPPNRLRSGTQPTKEMLSSVPSQAAGSTQKSTKKTATYRPDEHLLLGENGQVTSALIQDNISGIGNNLNSDTVKVRQRHKKEGFVRAEEDGFVPGQGVRGEEDSTLGKHVKTENDTVLGKGIKQEYSVKPDVSNPGGEAKHTRLVSAKNLRNAGAAPLNGQDGQKTVTGTKTLTGLSNNSVNNGPVRLVSAEQLRNGNRTGSVQTQIRAGSESKIKIKNTDTLSNRAKIRGEETLTLSDRINTEDGTPLTGNTESKTTGRHTKLSVKTPQTGKNTNTALGKRVRSEDSFTLRENTRTDNGKTLTPEQTKKIKITEGTEHKRIKLKSAKTINQGSVTVKTAEDNFKSVKMVNEETKTSSVSEMPGRKRPVKKSESWIPGKDTDKADTKQPGENKATKKLGTRQNTINKHISVSGTKGEDLNFASKSRANTDSLNAKKKIRVNGKNASATARTLNSKEKNGFKKKNKPKPDLNIKRHGGILGGINAGLSEKASNVVSYLCAGALAFGGVAASASEYSDEMSLFPAAGQYYLNKREPTQEEYDELYDKVINQEYYEKDNTSDEDVLISQEAVWEMLDVFNSAEKKNSKDFDKVKITEITWDNTPLTVTGNETVSGSKTRGFFYYYQRIDSGSDWSQKQSVPTYMPVTATGKKITVIYQGKGESYTQNLYPSSTGQQYFGFTSVGDTVDFSRKTANEYIIGWTFEEGGHTVDIPRYAAFNNNDYSSVYQDMLVAHASNNRVTLYPVYAGTSVYIAGQNNNNFNQSANKLSVITESDIAANPDTLSEDDLSIRYAYVDEDGNTSYSSVSDDSLSNYSRNQLFRSIMSMAVIATENSIKYPYLYVDYCTGLLKQVLADENCYATINYTTKVLNSAKASSSDVKLGCEITIYVNASIESLMQMDTTTADDLNEMAHSHNVGTWISNVWGNISNFFSGIWDSIWWGVTGLFGGDDAHDMMIASAEQAFMYENYYTDLDSSEIIEAKEGFERYRELHKKMAVWSSGFAGWTEENKETARMYAELDDDTFNEMFMAVFPSEYAYMPGNSTAAKVFNNLINRGFTVSAALGVLGNMKYQTDMDEDYENVSRGTVGLLKFNKTELNEFAEAYDENWDTNGVSISTQVAFMVSKMNSSYWVESYTRGSHIPADLDNYLDAHESSYVFMPYLDYKQLTDTEQAAIAFAASYVHLEVSSGGGFTNLDLRINSIDTPSSETEAIISLMNLANQNGVHPAGSNRQLTVYDIRYMMKSMTGEGLYPEAQTQYGGAADYTMAYLQACCIITVWDNTILAQKSEINYWHPNQPTSWRYLYKYFYYAFTHYQQVTTVSGLCYENRFPSGNPITTAYMSINDSDTIYYTNQLFSWELWSASGGGNFSNGIGWYTAAKGPGGKIQSELDEIVEYAQEYAQYVVYSTSGSGLQQVVEIAKQIANDDSHGYTSTNGNWGNPDYDCGTFVAECYRKAGVANFFGQWNAAPELYGGTALGVATALTAFGFNDPMEITDESQLLPGDILISGDGGHVAIYIGDGKQAHASRDLDGRIGDSSGREVLVCNMQSIGKGSHNVWQYAVRHPSSLSGSSTGSGAISKFIEAAEAIANDNSNTYDTYGCSAFVRRALINSGLISSSLPWASSYQALKGQCVFLPSDKFKKIYSVSELKNGDIIIGQTGSSTAHMAIVVVKNGVKHILESVPGSEHGCSKNAEISTFSWHDCTNGWSVVYRYIGPDVDDSEISNGELKSNTIIAYFGSNRKYSYSSGFAGLGVETVYMPDPERSYNRGNLFAGYAVTADPDLPLGSVVRVETAQSGQGSAANKKYFIVASKRVPNTELEKTGNVYNIFLYAPTSDATASPYGRYNNCRVYLVDGGPDDVAVSYATYKKKYS